MITCPVSEDTCEDEVVRFGLSWDVSLSVVRELTAFVYRQMVSLLEESDWPWKLSKVVVDLPIGTALRDQQVSAPVEGGHGFVDQSIHRGALAVEPGVRAAGHVQSGYAHPEVKGRDCQGDVPARKPALLRSIQGGTRTGPFRARETPRRIVMNPIPCFARIQTLVHRSRQSHGDAAQRWSR